MSDPSCVDWFHGRITRDAAENLLQKTAMVDGTYLLRESTSAVGSYVLSVCKDHKVCCLFPDVYYQSLSILVLLICYMEHSFEIKLSASRVCSYQS